MNREELKEYLKENNFSCVLLEDEKVIMTSLEKGVSPLYNFIISNEELPKGKVEVGDKVIGRAVSFLAVYLGAKYIYTKLISETALDVLKKYDVEVEYDEVCPFIFNRNKDGQCPMEKALENIETPEEAFEIVDRFVKARNKK